MSISRKSMIGAIKENPLDTTVRAVCADVLEESGYIDIEVLTYLRGGEVPEMRRQVVRQELRQLFGTTGAALLSPEFFLPKLHALLAVIQNPEATDEERLRILEDACRTKDWLHSSDPDSQRFIEEFTELSECICVRIAEAAVTRLRQAIENPEATSEEKMAALEDARRSNSRLRRPDDSKRINQEIARLSPSVYLFGANAAVEELRQEIEDPKAALEQRIAAINAAYNKLRIHFGTTDIEQIQRIIAEPDM